MKYLYLFVAILFISACDSDDISVPDVKDVVNVKIDFNEGDNGWVAGFSDYPPGNDETFEFKSGIRSIPGRDEEKGFFISSVNRSDDVFMYLKRQVINLKPDTTYVLSGSVSFFTNAGTECFGIGGSPGESVFFKIGATELEPKQVDYYMNIDIGSQAQSGSDSVVVGTIGVAGIGCHAEKATGQKTLKLNPEDGFEFISSDEGKIWIYLGTDSGFEGRTDMIYTDLELKLTESN